MQLAKLLVVHVAGRARHQVRTRLRLGERNNVAQGLGAGQQEGEPVHAQRDTTVRRRAELERVQQEAELRLRLLLANAQRLEDLRLDLRVMQTDGAAANLEAVEHHV